MGVSGWRLARAVSRRGHLGVVSGTGCDLMLARGLEDGDPEGHLRRALSALPVPAIARHIVSRFHRPAGRPPGRPYRSVPMLHLDSPAERWQLCLAGAFVEVFLAREGHAGRVGINLLTKLQFPALPTLYGAMLAGVEVVLMGAGIPREIPGALDHLAAHEPASIRLEVVGADKDERHEIRFDPREHGIPDLPPLTRPQFLAIVSSNLLATLLARKASGRVDGFVVEAATAGGHNAPPRAGDAGRNLRGEPVYGPRDEVDLAALETLGLPYWLAGGTGTPTSLASALEAGASGIQVGTLFAFCEESGLAPDLRRWVLEGIREDDLDLLTDPQASPTGYPFKVLTRRSDPPPETPPLRLCDIGSLRTAYRRSDGRVGYRCPAEPVEAYVAKGGDAADTVGRRCLCNTLLANVGRGQIRPDGSTVPPLITAGDQVLVLGEFLDGRDSYTADDVLAYLLGGSGDRAMPI